MKCGCDPHVEWCPECRASKRNQENRERGWIECSEEMPPEDKAYNTFVMTWDGHFVREDRRPWDTLMHRFKWERTLNPTHWMHLPLPPVTD